MPVPIQPVTSFSESELWYMYQQLTEINANTSGGSGGLSQTEVYEIFNGTNPQGYAVSLFESLSGSDTPLANLLVETISGSNFSAANVLYDSYLKLSSINTNTGNAATTLSNIDGTTQTIEGYSQNIQNNTSSIDTKLTTSNTNTTNISTYLSTVRNAVLTSTTGSLTVAPAVHNISVYNSGAAAGTINVSGGGAISIPSGVTVNFDAGGNNNRYAANTFVLNATGTTFIVSYTS